MASALLLQQQQAGRLAPIPADCWQFWTASTLASALQCPVDNIASDWPAIHAALLERGIVNRAVCAAALATIAIETASTFQPVREAFWLPEAWRRDNLRYYPWYGRGYIQLTWETNYATYGRAVGVNLMDEPDLAMEPATAARIFAEFFLQSGAASAAQLQDWRECRRRVQGGADGLERLRSIVAALLNATSRDLEK